MSSLRLSNGSQGKILEETSRGGCPCPISSNVDGGGRILSVFLIFLFDYENRTRVHKNKHNLNKSIQNRVTEQI